MPHHGTKTFCCGEGGSAGFISRDLAKNWGVLRNKEADGKTIIAYCAGCTNFLNPLTPTSHIIDLIFEPEATMSGNVKVSKAPFTYLNRLRLKKHFKKTLHGTRTRERTFTSGEESKKGQDRSSVKKVILMRYPLQNFFSCLKGKFIKIFYDSFFTKRD